MGSNTDAQVARSIAESAGKFLLKVREEWGTGDPRALGREGDRAAQELIAAELTRRFPNDSILSEEAQDSTERLNAARVWIVDPLDGTREYGEGRADWAVHIALWERGRLAAGAVAIPGEGRVLNSESVGPVPPRTGAVVRLAVSRSRPPSLTEPIRSALGAELVEMGSAGVKIVAVIRGLADAYVHAGGQYQWDSAAPVAIAVAAGLHASRIDGTPLEYNAADPYLPDVVVCRPDLTDQILEAIAGAHKGGEP